MKKEDFSRLKKILIQKRRFLLRADSDMANDIKEETMNRHGDDVDVAEFDYGQAMTFLMKNRCQDELSYIDEAIVRIDNGEYGMCAECGDKIIKKRLEVMPYSILCVECQEGSEKSRV
jgi:DnaK suppressor protein